MANHIRRQLREAVASAVTGLTTTGARVYQSRVYPLQTGTDLPGLRVYTTEEQAAPDSIHAPALIDRTVEIRIEGVAKATADLDDTLDLIAKEVETALASGVTISAKGIPLAYTGCVIELNGEGEQQLGMITLNYAARIFNAANAPDVFL
jgi:hypothetical protein